MAVHLYDTSRVRLNGASLERNSHLNVFELTGTNVWLPTQTLALTRPAGNRRDNWVVETQAVWLDLGQRTIPMIHVKIMENETPEPIKIGNRTYIYGVLLGQSDSQAFISFNGYIPCSNTTVTLSQMSHPDVKRQLTVLTITSDPGENSYVAYGWTGNNWKVVRTSTSENNDKAPRWNGSRFVPLSSPSSG